VSSRAEGKQVARERVAEMRAAQARAERRRRVMLASGAVGLVLVVVVALVIAKVAGVGSSKDDGKAGTKAAAAGNLASASVVKAITSVPPATLDAVGVGAATNAPNPIQAPPLSVDGKPQVLYMGGEFCPFCAGERWAIVVALSRFGTWSDLGATESSGQDVHPNTPTVSFHGASYTSDYLSFTGKETADRDRQPLDKLTATEQQIVTTYNAAPYVPADAAGTVPFMDLGGVFINSGANYDVGVLDGKTREEIARSLKDPQDPVAQAIDGAANVLTARLCELTKNAPANVCTSGGVKAAAAVIAKAK
jgi:uncharacterized protein DUF929